MYTSDGNGVAFIDEAMAGFSLYLYDRLPVFGRAVVLHHNNGARVGCGVIGGAFGVQSAHSITKPYPGYNSAYYRGHNVKTVASFTEESGVLTMRAVLSGLEPLATGGIHIHSGFACSSDGAITGGHCTPLLS